MKTTETIKKCIRYGLLLLLVFGIYVQASAAQNTTPEGQFKEVKGKWYYISVDKGTKVKGWIVYEGGRYYLNAQTGEVMTGFRTIGGKLYYLDPRSKIPGKASKGWKTIQKKTYFFNRTTGANMTGFIKDRGKTYYCSSTSRHRFTGWHNIRKKRYYFDPETGEMRTGLVRIGGKVYFFDSSGVLVTDEKTIQYNGLALKTSSDGVATCKDSVAREAVKVLNRVGWDLEKAFDWLGKIRGRAINDEVPAGRKPTEYFAGYGFQNLNGDCNVKAAMFCYMARILGYEAYFVARKGNLNYHSWTEIVIDGVSYVCDRPYRKWMVPYGSAEAAKNRGGVRME